MLLFVVLNAIINYYFKLIIYLIKKVKRNKRANTKMTKKLYIFCSAAMSSSAIAAKMQQSADNQNLQIQVQAFAESNLNAKAPEADVIILSPQIRYLEKTVKQTYPNKIVYIIEMTDYIPTKAENILTKTLNLL